jgi:hypothetical protein
MLRGPTIKLTLLVGAFTAAFALIFVQSFRTLGYLLTNVDSLLFFSSFHAARDFGSIADLQTFAFGQGFGAFQHPALFNLFWWLLDWTASVQLSYLITEFLVFVSVFAFAYFASSSLLVSGIAAFFATAFFFVPALFVDHFGTAVPQAILQIAFVYLGLAVIGFGLRRPLWISAGFAILLYAIVTDWMYFIFSIPFVGLCLVGVALSASVGAERKTMRGAWTWLLLGTVVTIGLWYASGIPDAYNAFTLMSVRAWSPWGLLPEYPRSLLIWGGVTHQRLATIVGIAAILSMVYLIWLRARFFVFVCPGVLAFLLLLAIADIDSTGANIYWTLPALGYFERPLIPFYAVAIAYAFAQLVRRSPLSSRLRALSAALGDLDVLRPGALAVVLLASGAAATIVVFASVLVAGRDLSGLIYRAPYYWERTMNFVQRLPIPRRSDALFAPYFIDLSPEQLINDCPHLHDPGVPPRSPRYCLYMFNFHSARNFFEPHNLADIQNYQMFAAALEMGRLDTDHRPTNLAGDRRDGLAALSTLVPVSDFSLEYRPGAVAIEVRSAGESIILLPFQFSHCLRLSQGTGEGAELIRVDGGQAALHFVNRADVRIANALTYFGDSGCRKRDFADVFRLGIWPLLSFDDLAQGRRVPLLMKFYLDARLRFRDRIMRESRADEGGSVSLN